MYFHAHTYVLMYFHAHTYVLMYFHAQSALLFEQDLYNFYTYLEKSRAPTLSYTMIHSGKQST